MAIVKLVQKTIWITPSRGWWILSAALWLVRSFIILYDLVLLENAVTQFAFD